MAADAVKTKLWTDRYVWTAAAVSLLVVGELAWAAFGEVVFGPGKNPNYTHLHCSACQYEYNYAPMLEGKHCPRCGERRSRLLPTIGSLAKGGYTPGTLRWGRVVLFFLVLVVLVQSQFFLCLWRMRVLRRAEEAVRRQKFYCLCPFCDRKLGYVASKAGKGVVCPTCKTGFLLPEADDPDGEEDPVGEEPASPGC